MEEGREVEEGGEEEGEVEGGGKGDSERLL